MGKHTIPNYKADARIPANVRLKTLARQYETLQHSYEKMRQLLWCAVSVSNGRIEMDIDLFNMTQQAPPTDTLVKVESYIDPETRKEKVVIVFCDAEGKRLPESEPNLIIVPKAFKENAAGGGSK